MGTADTPELCRLGHRSPARHKAAAVMNFRDFIAVTIIG
jgi:hypothetical protein